MGGRGLSRQKQTNKQTMQVNYSSNNHHCTRGEGTGLAGASVVPNSQVYSVAFFAVLGYVTAQNYKFVCHYGHENPSRVRGV
jgi:hypothetical protein